MIPIARSVHAAEYPKVCAVMGSQMSKTETMVNIIGARLDLNPVPMLYVAPTKTFVENVFEPRLRTMIEQCPSLWMKRRPGKQEKKTMKYIAGVTVRMAWAGSATEMAGQAACKVFVDERDRMDDNVEGEGDPVELADARHSTYPDGQTIVFSTPTLGTAELEVQDGLEFFKSTPLSADRDSEYTSATWKLWQEGTRRHWAVPCPKCKAYFIPRFKQLWFPHDKAGKSCSPLVANREARLMCFCCGELIHPKHKQDMNALGVFVAPGQRVSTTGKVSGACPESSTDSFWISGLMSPWVTWGALAERWLKAVLSGDPERIQAVINTKFGELYSVAGDAPSKDVVMGLRQPYQVGELPAGILKIFMGVDVQKGRLVWVMRGFGVDMASWLLDYGELHGATDEPEVWNDLALFRDVSVRGSVAIKCFIDSGYRTQFVYKFCREFAGWGFPTKGRDTIDSAPLIHSKVDNTATGKRVGLGVWHLNTDFFKRWIHERLVRDPGLPGGFHLPEDASEDYCLQLVSEARVVKPSGKVVWVQIRRDNHYLDAEVNVLAAAYSANMQSYTSRWAERTSGNSRKAPRRRSEEDEFKTHRPEKRGGNSWFNRD